MHDEVSVWLASTNIKPARYEAFTPLSPTNLLSTGASHLSLRPSSLEHHSIFIIIHLQRTRQWRPT